MSSEIESFHPVDYLVFALNLVISLGIGLYVGYGQRKASSQGGAHGGAQGGSQGGGTAQYHTAELNLIPVACSMVMSYISGLIVLGNTAEMYLNGVQNWLACIGSSIAFMFSALVLVPFFHPMKLTSSFEYLERRFESVVIRVWASILFMISSIIYMGLSLYTPATALEAVTEFPAWASISVCGVVCMIYTSLGGVKAVIWTDTVQGSILIIGVIVVVVGGAIEVGGLGEIFDIASEGERMKMFNFSFNPTIRLTFWSLMVGRFFISLNYVGTGQISIQRFSSLKSLKDAQWSAILNIPAIIIIYTLTCLGGLTVYAYYAAKGCDPLANGDISSSNQLMPYFIMETLHYPGVPGIFLAVLFSGALSSLSSSLNSCAACLWKDILALKLAHITDNRKMIINKFCVLLFGAAGVGMAFISEQLGGHVLQASQSLIGASGGPSTGLFLLGAFFPCSNKWGALFGSIIGFIMGAWMSLGGYIAELPWSSLPTSTENCTTSSTDIYHSMYSAARSNLMATTAGYEEEDNEVFAYYRVSFMYASMWGCLVTIFTGLLISFATGSTNPRTLDPMLTAPVFDRLCCCLPARWRRPCWCGVQHDQYDQEKASHECDGKKNSLEMIDSSTKYNGDLKHESEVDLKEDWNSYIEVVKM